MATGALVRGHPVREQLVRRYAYGIPNEDALSAIGDASAAGVVELGAGTGYWARLLYERGVDVIAYDRWPPPSSENPFFDESAPWYPLRTGDEQAVDLHPQRTLLLVWPAWNEVWPGVAAARFHAAGGQRLVYVGEGPGGRTGDAVLHAHLGLAGPCLACRLGVVDAPCLCAVPALWRLVRSVAVANWEGADDACGVFERIDRPHDRWRRLRQTLLRSPTADSGRSRPGEPGHSRPWRRTSP